MRSLRRQSRTEEVEISTVPKTTEATPPPKKIQEDSIGEATNADLQAMKLELEKKIQAIQQENDRLKASSNRLTKNEEKILNAIRSEKLEQQTETPIISTSMLRKKYKVHPNYQAVSIKGLIDKSIIKREEAIFSGSVKTYRWKIL